MTRDSSEAVVSRHRHATLRCTDTVASQLLLLLLLVMVNVSRTSQAIE
jgi:hypothetical protein